jgi:hypothetical protein
MSVLDHADNQEMVRVLDKVFGRTTPSSADYFGRDTGLLGKALQLFRNDRFDSVVLSSDRLEHPPNLFVPKLYHPLHPNIIR